jgi:hypothetical protein
MTRPLSKPAWIAGAAALVCAAFAASCIESELPAGATLVRTMAAPAGRVFPGVYRGGDRIYDIAPLSDGRFDITYWTDTDPVKRDTTWARFLPISGSSTGGYLALVNDGAPLGSSYVYYLLRPVPASGAYTLTSLTETPSSDARAIAARHGIAMSDGGSMTAVAGGGAPTLAAVQALFADSAFTQAVTAGDVELTPLEIGEPVQRIVAAARANFAPLKVGRPGAGDDGLQVWDTSITLPGMLGPCHLDEPRDGLPYVLCTILETKARDTALAHFAQYREVLAAALPSGWSSHRLGLSERDVAHVEFDGPGGEVLFLAVRYFTDDETYLAILEVEPADPANP